MSFNAASFASGLLLLRNFSASATSEPARANIVAVPPSQTKASQGVHRHGSARAIGPAVTDAESITGGRGCPAGRRRNHSRSHGAGWMTNGWPLL
jgi:hypothetical protein